MTGLAVLVTRRPKTVIAAVVLASALFAAQIPRLTKDDSVDRMLPEGDPVLEYTRQVDEIFGGDEFLIVCVEPPQPLTPASVAKLVRLTRDFESIPGIREVVSPTNTKNVLGAPGMMHAEPLIDEVHLPRTPDEVADYLSAIRAKDLFRGTIVSEDGAAFGFVLRLHKDADKNAVVNAVSAVVEEERGPESIYFSGSPAINLQVGRHMGRDMGRFFPLVVVVLLATLWCCFRTLWGVVLPFLSLLLAAVWTLGAMAISGTPVSVIATMIPTILMAVGSSYGIHVLTQFYEERSSTHPLGQTVVDTVVHIAPTIALAGITTVIGFGSLLLNDARILREFGVFCAFGIACNMLLSVTFIPACLSLTRAPGGRSRSAGKAGPLSALLAKISLLTTRRRTALLVLFTLLVAGSLAGYPRLFLETNAVNFFRESDPVRQTIGRVSTNFGGTIPIRTVVDAHREGAILSPEYLGQIEAYQRYLEGFDRVGHTVSIADVIKDMNVALHEGDPAYFTLPDTLEEAEQYLFLYSLASDPDEFQSLIDDTHSQAAVLARLRQVDGANLPLGTRETRRILDQVQEYIGSGFSPELTVTPTGRARNIVRTSDYIVVGLLRSIGLSVALIWVAGAIFFRSATAGFMVVLPVSIALTLNFGVMAWLRIPLDIATTLISSIAIGIGVDDSIHYIICHRREVSRAGAKPLEATARSAQRAGRAILRTSIALVLGFSVLTVASFRPVIYFGGLTALTMVTTTLGALLVLPAALSLWQPSFLRR